MSAPDVVRLRVGQYLRVSKDRSGRQRSVDEQRNDNERAAADQPRWDLSRSYTDSDRSASRFATRVRGDFTRLVADIAAAELDVLILWESSRGSRKVGEWENLIDSAASVGMLFYVTSHDRTYDPRRPRDRRSLLEDAVSADYESGQTSERVKRTVRAVADAGRPFGSIPYGYRRTYDVGSSSPTGQLPDEKTAPIVREIVRRVLSGEGLHAIAVDLNERGVLTPQMVRDKRLGRTGVTRGGWNNPKIRKLLDTPTLSGWRVHDGRAHREAIWPGLISEADHAAVRAVLNDPNRRTQRGTAPKYLLSGIGRCGAVVGGEMCGGWLRHFRNRGYEAYGCNGRNGTGAGHVTRRMEKLDAMVLVRVIQRLTDPVLLQVLNRRRDGLDDEARQAAENVTRLRGEIEALEVEAQRRVRDNAGSAMSMLRILDGLHEQLGLAVARQAAARQIPAVVVEMAGPDAATRWTDATIQVQRELVRSLVSVTVRPSSLPSGSNLFDESTIDIVDL